MNLNRMTKEQLFDYYKQIAGRANKRLERLEKSGLTNGTAYRTAMKATATQQIRKSGGRRFSLSKPKNIQELRSRVRATEGFLSDVTSTPGGIKKVAKKIAKTIEKKYGLTLTPEQVGQTFESGLWSSLNNRYGSGTAVIIMGSVQKSDGKLKDTLEDLSNKNVYLSESEQRSLGRTMRKYKKDNSIDFLYHQL